MHTHTFTHTYVCHMHTPIISAHLNVYVGASSSALSKQWYYEVRVIELSHPAHLRAGWAHAINFCAHPTSDGVTSGRSLGDDMYSIGFDGHTCWVGGSPVIKYHHVSLKAGDVIGCYIDVEKGVAFFALNGALLLGSAKLGYLTEQVTPSVSLSCGAR